MSFTIDSGQSTTGDRHRLERADIAVVDATSTRRLEGAWGRLQTQCAKAIRELKWNDFLVVDYDLAPADADTPAAWIRTGPKGAECAVTSAQQLSAEEWPFHAEHFQEHGWRAPAGTDQPWTSGPHDPLDAALRVITALRDGRECRDPFGFHWGAGSFPVPEGVTGTLTIIDPERGVAQV